MNNINGRKRVIIENVEPSVAGGRFPAKSVLGNVVQVTADIFSDGHDVLDATVHYRTGNGRWQSTPMHLISNDKWTGEFYADKTGFYEFRIEAWIDHFTTWKQGLQKKHEAHQDVSVEMQIGAAMLEEVAAKANQKTKDRLLKWAAQFKERQPADAVALATSDDLASLVRIYGDRGLSTTSASYRLEVERKKAGFSTWYELFPRSAAQEPDRHGTFKDVERLLPRIQEMGFDVLYLPPIHPIGESKRKGRNNALTTNEGDPGSPWAIGNREGGHKAIHPLLGTLEDFQSLIRAAEQQGIEIAMDIAYQCAPDHPYVKAHPQWFRWRPDGTVQYAENPPKKYEDILPINFETEDWQNLWKELKSVIDYWVKQGVRIFRIDNPHTKAFAFWEWMIAEVRKKNPEVLFLAEAFTRPRLMEWLAKTGFNQSYTYFTWRNNPKEMQEYMEELTQTELRHYFRPNFWPNTPDILPPVLSQGGEPAFIMRVLLAGTLSSSYGIYGPVYEYGINTPSPKKEENIDNEKYEIKHWDWDKKTKIRDVITRLNQIRKENPALQDTNNISFGLCNNDNFLCYVKANNGKQNTLIVIVNMDPFNTQEGSVYLTPEQLGIKPGHPYCIEDLLTGAQYQWYDHWNYVKLNPQEMPAHIFLVKQPTNHTTIYEKQDSSQTNQYEG